MRAAACWLVLLAAGCAGKPFPGVQDEWRGYTRWTASFESRRCYIVAPAKTAAGKPWIWRARFWEHRPEVDLALLARGFHLVYIELPGMFGSPRDVAMGDRFYRWLTEEHGFNRRVALEGMSRAGLFVYNWAAANPGKVACIYADAPVCDFKSWPRGRGGTPRLPDLWDLLLKDYGFAGEDEALRYTKNPVDNLVPLARARIPLLHVHGDADLSVPLEENTAIVEQRYRQLGGEIVVIVKKGVGHVHGLDDPSPIVEFILRHSR